MQFFKPKPVEPDPIFMVDDTPDELVSQAILGKPVVSGDMSTAFAMLNDQRDAAIASAQGHRRQAHLSNTQAIECEDRARDYQRAIDRLS